MEFLDPPLGIRYTFPEHLYSFLVAGGVFTFALLKVIIISMLSTFLYHQLYYELEVVNLLMYRKVFILQSSELKNIVNGIVSELYAISKFSCPNPWLGTQVCVHVINMDKQ